MAQPAVAGIVAERLPAPLRIALELGSLRG
jgi:hypothetical protein